MDSKKRAELLAPTFEKLQKFSEMITAALFTSPIHCEIYQQKLKDALEVERKVEMDNQVQLVTDDSQPQVSSPVGNSPSTPIQTPSPTINNTTIISTTSITTTGESNHVSSPSSPPNATTATGSTTVEEKTETTSSPVATNVQPPSSSEGTPTTTPSSSQTTTTHLEPSLNDFCFEKRKIEVEVDWESFNELFNTLFNEGAPEVIETILNSFLSKSCAASLIGTLISQYCKPPQNRK